MIPGKAVGLDTADHLDACVACIQYLCPSVTGGCSNNVQPFAGYVHAQFASMVLVSVAVRKIRRQCYHLTEFS